jgi:hypothetical protein
MFTIDNFGIPLTFLKITPGNTAVGIGDEFVTYTERTFVFTSGGGTEIKVGDWIVGATSNAHAQVVSIDLATGSWAGTDAAGTMRVRSVSGTFQAGEKIKVAGGTDDATMTAPPVPYLGDYPFKGMRVRAMRVSVTGATALVNYDGGTPDQTSLLGDPLASGTYTMCTNVDEIRKFKCIDYTAGSASTLFITFYF